mmetsp:Transcript_90098/g.280486  ORF Transcript_90098/g.280486 Transcript_90098/m.280486 type:complete len:284 (+) Transcript_90098:1135-1986(+)
MQRHESAVGGGWLVRPRLQQRGVHVGRRGLLPGDMQQGSVRLRARRIQVPGGRRRDVPGAAAVLPLTWPRRAHLSRALGLGEGEARRRLRVLAGRELERARVGQPDARFQPRHHHPGQGQVQPGVRQQHVRLGRLVPPGRRQVRGRRAAPQGVWHGALLPDRQLHHRRLGEGPLHSRDGAQRRLRPPRLQRQGGVGQLPRGRFVVRPLQRRPLQDRQPVLRDPLARELPGLRLLGPWLPGQVRQGRVLHVHAGARPLVHTRSARRAVRVAVSGLGEGGGGHPS